MLNIRELRETKNTSKLVRNHTNLEVNISLDVGLQKL